MLIMRDKHDCGTTAAELLPDCVATAQDRRNQRDSDTCRKRSTERPKLAHPHYNGQTHRANSCATEFRDCAQKIPPRHFLTITIVFFA